MSSPFLNPLRYPGSKARSIEFFAEIARRNDLVGREIVEPYAGSGAVSFGLLERKLVSRAMFFERDPLVFSFWHCVFHRCQELIDAVLAVEVTLDTWHRLDVLRNVDDVNNNNIVQLGLAGLFFNRTNFSGVIHAGPIGGQSQTSDYSISCRFNKADLVKRIRDASSFGDRVSVFFGDAVHALEDAKSVNNENRFFYVDPPYFEQGRKLYRYHYRFGDHERLAGVLADASYDWVLSYDSHAVIDFLYSDHYKFRHVFRYSSKAHKMEEELVISNRELNFAQAVAAEQRTLPFDDEDETNIAVSDDDLALTDIN
ncbi:DNA adenine methylase [Trinickia sp. YCB016]